MIHILLGNAEDDVDSVLNAAKTRKPLVGWIVPKGPTRVTELYFTCQPMDLQHAALSELNHGSMGRGGMAGIGKQFARLRFSIRPSH